jgi:membrane-associated phospholipid phosphatase
LNFALVSTISVVLVTIITIKWKISAHLTGIGGLTGMIFSLLLKTNGNLLIWFFISILLAGILGSARLVMDAHSPKQIYSGFAVGFFSALFIMIFL